MLIVRREGGEGKDVDERKRAIPLKRSWYVLAAQGRFRR